VAVTGSDATFWRGRRVLVTGHTGFKGAWLVLMLQALGAKVTGIALEPEDGPSMFAALAPWTGLDDRRLDITEGEAFGHAVRAARPEIVFHLAAQALVGRGYADPVRTFATNVEGTRHLLAALRGLEGVRAAVIVTSDKVYRNDGHGRAFVESDPLGGADPYSASKACAELLVAGWCASFRGELPAIATARGGNVIGGGDFGADRLLPDLLRAQASGVPLVVRRARATRPWQYVVDVLDGYLCLARCLAEQPADAPGAVNFGPDPAAAVSVQELLALYGRATEAPVRWSEAAQAPFAEAPRLAVDPGLAWRRLGWRTATPLADALAATARWASAWRNGQDLRTLSLALVEAAGA
jgi:CDP-glucose 4,6-dehydratase